jgi:hypothetical protein
VAVAAVLMLLARPGSGAASGGRYVFAGGTPAEQAQVTAALAASSFDWSVVPGTIVVHIARGSTSDATPGSLWLDADLLDAGRFAWGVVQHEYAHEVDFLVLSGAQRAQLQLLLGGRTWWNDGTLPHADYGCERFADEVAWAYWPDSDNVMRPASSQDEGGQVPPAAFRRALETLLPGLAASPPASRATAAEGRQRRTERPLPAGEPTVASGHDHHD